MSGYKLHGNRESRKKALGAFYTHNGLTDIICAWAITSSDCEVLEPSFGGCGFLRSARDRILELGSKAPDKQIFGCDIDRDAFGHLAKLFEGPVDLNRFREGDFLDQNYPQSWFGRFGSVIGNPPYLPYRKIDPIKRERAVETLASYGLQLDRRASLWAYFVALSIPLIAKGGRMAWVLPSSFLHANYSFSLRKNINSIFTNVRAFELQERQFLLEGTEEKTVVLLADDKIGGLPESDGTDIALSRCSGIRDLKREIQNWTNGALLAASSCGTSVFDSLSKAPRDLYSKLISERRCHKLGEHLSVQIGLVTGDNKFFLRNNDERMAAGLSVSSLKSLLPRFVFASGLDFQTTDFDEMIASGGKGYLVSWDGVSEVPEETKNYLSTYPKKQRDSCSTFKKRKVWSQPDDGSMPDAFFPVMQHNGPRVLLNKAEVNCTNSVHRGYFRSEKSKAEKHLIALSSITTFSQLSAEIVGRSYGSGALKHEPREAEKIRLLLPRIHHNKILSEYRKADICIRDGNFDEASQIADRLIFEAMELGDIATHVSILRSGLGQARKHRQR